jgi:hypothetical protein
MAEFLVVFIVTLLIVTGVAAALVFGRAPVYRPDTEHIQSLLTRMLEGSLPETEWDFFIGMPIRHDESLEVIRTQCSETYEQYSIRARSGNARMKEEGLIRLRHILVRLESNGSKTF